MGLIHWCSFENFFVARIDMLGRSFWLEVLDNMPKTSGKPASIPDSFFMWSAKMIKMLCLANFPFRFGFIQDKHTEAFKDRNPLEIKNN